MTGDADAHCRRVVVPEGEREGTDSITAMLQCYTMMVLRESGTHITTTSTLLLLLLTVVVHDL